MKEIFGIKILVALALIIFAGIAWAAGESAKKAGIHEEVLSLKNGNTMRYTLSIPDSYSQQPVPLVLALHYGGTVTPYYGRGLLAYLVEPALRELAPIIAAPDCPARGWENPISEAAVMELLDYIKENFRIDDKKIVVTGFSMGGIGSWYYAGRYPDVFSAAIPIAGTTDADTAAKIGDIPLYVIHSRVDRVLPIAATEKIVAELKAKGKPVEFVVLESIDHYDTSGFTAALKGAVPWLKKIWQKNK
jgi:predicted peptidase